jgi:hypothetical protein
LDSDTVGRACFNPHPNEALVARGRKKQSDTNGKNGNGANLGFEADLFLAADKLRKARCSLLAAGLIAYESPLYQVLSLEPTSTSEPPVARTGQTLPISAILRQMLETGGVQQPLPSP